MGTLVFNAVQGVPIQSVSGVIDLDSKNLIGNWGVVQTGDPIVNKNLSLPSGNLIVSYLLTSGGVAESSQHQISPFDSFVFHSIISGANTETFSTSVSAEGLDLDYLKLDDLSLIGASYLTGGISTYNLTPDRGLQSFILDYNEGQMSFENSNGIASISLRNSILSGNWNTIGTPLFSGNNPSWSSSINVKSFGAQGDGITNDFDAIQHAINSVNSVGLFFPQGNYLTTGRLKLINANNLKLYGENAKLISSGENDFQKIIIKNATGVLWDGINMDGGRTGATNEQYSGMITLTNCDTVAIRNSKFSNYLGLGIYLSGNNSNVEMSENKFTGFHIGIFSTINAGSTGKYFQVHDNLFEGAWGANNQNFFGAVKIQGNIAPYLTGGFNYYVPNSYGHRIINNTCNNTSQMGIELWGYVSESIVADNTINGPSTQFGISIAASSASNLVSNNTIKGTTYIGIELADSYDNTVIGNSVDGLDSTGIQRTQDGIIVNNSRNSIINGNRVKDCSHGNFTTYANPYATLFSTNQSTITVANGTSLYHQGGNFTRFTNNVMRHMGTGLYFIMLDSDLSVTSGFYARDNDFFGNISQWGILAYDNNGHGTGFDYFISDNRVNINSGGFGGINFATNSPKSYIIQNNYSLSGSSANFNDSSFPGSISPYGTTNLYGGIQYYGSQTYAIPNDGIGNSGIWLCLWSGGYGYDGVVRAAITNDYPVNNQQSATEISAYVSPYNNDTHQLIISPNLFYNGSRISEIRTCSHSDAATSIWVNFKTVPSSSSGAPVYTYFSKQNYQGTVYSQSGAPAWSSDSAVVYPTQDLESQKISKGFLIGNNNQIYSNNSGLLILNTNTGLLSGQWNIQKIGFTGVNGAPSNTITVQQWIDVVLPGGLYKMPLYQ